MIFNEEDIMKFYQLLSRYDITAPNVGIVGTKEVFNRKIHDILNMHRKNRCRIMVNEDRTLYRVIINDMEYCYIHIRQPQDLIGRRFRKFM